MSPATQAELGDLTFTTATDGNHGRGVAWGASQLGCKAVIYVHKDTSQPRIDAIRSYGAEVRVVDGTYDDADFTGVQFGFGSTPDDAPPPAAGARRGAG